MLKNKKLVASFIVIVFLAVTVVGFLTSFSVKKVDISATISKNGGKYVEEVNKALSVYKGKNILFIDANELKVAANASPYLEVINVEKKYPNVLSVTLKERQETFFLTAENGTFLVDNFGYVLDKTDDISGRQVIEIEGITFENLKVGSKVTFSVEKLNDIFSVALNLSAVASYYNNVNKIVVDYGVERANLKFVMNTGVSLVVYKALDDGEEKMQEAFSFFDGLDDYKKSVGEITVDKNVAGAIFIVYNENPLY